METLITMTIVTGLLFAVTIFTIDTVNFGNALTPTFQSQQELQLATQNMSMEMQTMQPSNGGAYPIAQVGTSTVTFFSDLDEDGLMEQIRYFLDGATLKKGVTKPTGNPPIAYNSQNETINDVAHYITANAPIFTYYADGYTGTQPPLAYPINISQIQLIGIDLSAQQSGMNEPITFSLKITPRNLRTN